MKKNPLIKIHTAIIAMIVNTIVLTAPSFHDARANGSAKAPTVQQLVTEYLALVNDGEQWDEIGTANEEKRSDERGGGNSETKVEWTDYRIVKLPGRSYQVSVGLHQPKEKLLQIIQKWQAYNPKLRFELVTLSHSAESRVWSEAKDQGLSYVIYSGNLAKSESK